MKYTVYPLYGKRMVAEWDWGYRVMDMTDEQKLPVPLEMALDETGAVLEGAKADLGKLQGLQERTLRNRTRLLDRYHQLPLYGKAREQAETATKSRWKIAGCPSDHPLVQMVLALRSDEEELVALQADMEPREFVRAKLAIKSKLADLLIALQKENDKVYDEVTDVVKDGRLQAHHEDKMRIAEGRSDADLSDDELAKKAKRLGITLNGD